MKFCKQTLGKSNSVFHLYNNIYYIVENNINYINFFNITIMDTITLKYLKYKTKYFNLLNNTQPHTQIGGKKNIIN